MSLKYTVITQDTDVIVTTGWIFSIQPVLYFIKEVEPRTAISTLFAPPLQFSALNKSGYVAVR